MKMCVCSECNTLYANFVFISGEKYTLTNRKRCFKCSPIRNKAKMVSDNEKKQRKHNYDLSRRKDFKIKAIEYKGGKCVVCGYDKYIGALDFHHLDPNMKDYTIGDKGRART